MAEVEDLEAIFRLRKHEPTQVELKELEEIKKKTTKNKFAFLRDGKVNLTENEIEKINQVNSKLEPIIPRNWRQDYKKFKDKKTGNERYVEMKSPPLLRRVGEHTDIGQMLESGDNSDSKSEGP